MGVIVFDVDGTILDLHSWWVREYNAATGDTKVLADIKGWHIHKYLPKMSKDGLYDLVNQHWIYEEVEPIDGALEVVTALRNKGHAVSFVTESEPHMVLSKYRRLDNLGFIASNKDLLVVPAMHRHMSLTHGVLVDDCLETAVQHPLGIVFGRPWNLDAPTRTKYILSYADTVGVALFIEDVLNQRPI